MGQLDIHSFHIVSGECLVVIKIILFDLCQLWFDLIAQITSEMPEMLFNFIQSGVMIDQQKSFHSIIVINAYGSFAEEEVSKLSFFDVLWQVTDLFA